MTGENDRGFGKTTAAKILRKQAKEKVAAGNKPFTEMSTLIHELRIHQVELEMQNEELRKSQAETERSRKAFQNLWELSPVGYLIVDFAGRVTAANRASQRHFGRPENALLNERFATLMAPENQVPVNLMFERAAETGIAERQEIRIMQPDGSIHICQLEVSSLGDETGREQIQAVLTDITKQKRAEDDLKKNEQEKIAILDSLMEHVIYHDREMKILWANNAACESVHLKREDLLDRNCHEVWADRRTPCENCPVIKARETGQTEMVEKMTPDGRWWYIQGHPVRDHNGHVMGTTEITLDITERKRAEEIVHKAKNELEIKVEERTAELFAANEKLRQEIEERKQAEEALRVNDIKYRTLVDNIPIGVTLINPNMEILTINSQLQKWFPNVKIDKKPLCYQAFNEPPGEGLCTYCPTIKTLQDGQVHESLTETPAGDEIRHYRIISSPIKDKEGKVVAGIEMVEDVTDRLRLEKTLQDSERRFRSIFEDTPIGFYRTTPDGRILDANPALIQILGYASFEELATVNLVAHDYHPDYSRKQFKERIERDGEILGMESLWKRTDETEVYIRENVRIVRDANGKIVRYEGTIEDISDQKQAADQVRNLSQQLIKAQEDERQMISRELHDRVAQDLSSVLIGLNTLFNRQPNVIPEVRKKALEFSEILQGTIGAVRDLSYEMSPPGLDDMGLIAALSMYCEEFAEKSGLKVDFQATGISAFRLDFDTEMNLYRLTQEGLNNIRKHAAARQATVKLVGNYPNIILRIEDDGKGFDLEERTRAAGSEKRMGLRSMAERVNLIRGEMAIQSQPMKGTQIFIKFPYQEEKHDSKKNYNDRR
jgi:PAS domain S-box-containing protein